MPQEQLADLHVEAGPNGISVVSVLQAIQEKYSYLPEELLREASSKLNIPLIDFYSVATFYKSFSLEPRGKHHIVTCMGTACHVRGGDRVTGEISRILKVDQNATSDDGEYSLEGVNCLGACALAPLVIVDGRHFGHMTPQKVRRLFDPHRGIFVQPGLVAGPSENIPCQAEAEVAR